MDWKFWNSAPVEHPTHLSIEEAAQQLVDGLPPEMQSRAKRGFFDRLAEVSEASPLFSVQGYLYEDRVTLCRAQSWLGLRVNNLFAPYFRGQFVDRDGKTWLIGKMGLHRLTCAAMAIGLVGFSVIGLAGAIAMFVSALADEDMPMWFALSAGLGWFGVTAAVIGLGAVIYRSRESETREHEAEILQFIADRLG